jgi:hypothetical protein
MNCSYRILKDVHIGVRVRKTKDKSTVPYKNEPITDAYLESWNDQGFRLKHDSFTTPNNTIWLDFYQLPLNKLNIEMGFIKNPIVFVEQILGGAGTTSMVLLRADTFDYLELLEDHQYKVESEKIKPSQLVPGDQVISCICRESNPMIFLGRFRTAEQTSRYVYSYNSLSSYEYFVEEAPEHAYFAYPQANGKYNVESYPLTNKKIVELYRAADKGKSFGETIFNDYEKNKSFIQEIFNDPTLVRYNSVSNIPNNPIEGLKLNGSYHHYYLHYITNHKTKKADAIKEAQEYFDKPEIKNVKKLRS